MSYTTTILPTQYIGATRPTINSNFDNLDQGLQTLFTHVSGLSAAFSTRVIGITSIDNCTPFAAQFIETYAVNTTPDNLKVSNLYNGKNPITRRLADVSYNCTVDGKPTIGQSGYYSLNSTTGEVSIPAGIYDINAGCSGYLCDAHTANIIAYDASTPNLPYVLLYGSCEDSPTYIDAGSNGKFSDSPSSDVKIRGRVILTAAKTIVSIKHLFSNPSSAHVGRTFGTSAPASLASLKTYLAYINIQKIKSL